MRRQPRLKHTDSFYYFGMTNERVLGARYNFQMPHLARSDVCIIKEKNTICSYVNRLTGVRVQLM